LQIPDTGGPALGAVDQPEAGALHQFIFNIVLVFAVGPQPVGQPDARIGVKGLTAVGAGNVARFKIPQQRLLGEAMLEKQMVAPQIRKTGGDVAPEKGVLLKGPLGTGLKSQVAPRHELQLARKG
jgi:hypothetical protein